MLRSFSSAALPGNDAATTTANVAALRKISEISLDGIVDAAQLELSVALRMPGELRARTGGDVQADVADDFCAQLAKRVGALQVGDPMDDGTDVSSHSKFFDFGTKVTASKPPAAQVVEAPDSFYRIFNK